ncbi:cellulase family glycosylhydrolase [Methylobacterium durans]|uniref:Calx-beta domain-containing protein n=1 Tax=Methylobacterium durans TaxID=2202825 RepID=UPI002AFFE97A|nr:Calx-beta domain-containing protein [Methylobacterium durans]MEA1834747.1 cellulase family glycosylhydrolase [Methylobacterium durans]
MTYGVDFSVSSSWNAGFIGSVSVKNTAPTGANGWLVEFDAPFEITNLWNGVIVSHVGTRYVVRDAGWNSTIAPNGSVSFGFQAASQGTAPAPTGFVVNGEAVGTGAPVPLPTVTIGDISIAEGNTGTAPASFKVSLSAASKEPITVAYSSANGTATAGADYTATSGTLTFAPGETSKTISVPVAGDTLLEGDETFRINLSGATKATIVKAAGIATIVNDDAAPPPMPSIGVSDITLKEGTGGTTNAVFTLTLSAASTASVTVGYQTQDGTALAGSDYAATSGRLTFAPGETVKTVVVPVTGDALSEGSEAFKLNLLQPTGATLAKAQATATITDDDAPRPTLSVADISVVEGNPVVTATGVTGLGSGYFHTQGSQILDAAGHTVKIAGVNWFGMESGRYAPDGLNVRNYKDMMQQMVDLGFNTIRLPFSDQLFDAASTPNSIDYGKNPDLAGLSGLQIMDKIVSAAGQLGLKVILDHHRSSAGAGASENGLWYNGTYSEQTWINNWSMLAKHFAGNSTVIGADLHNEPYNGTWGGGGTTDWAAAAERAGNAVLAANPNWLIFVEGVASYQNNFYWWGGNLMGVKDRPIQFSSPGHLVYSAHDYPNSIYGQPWFNDPSFPNNLPAKFDQMWGYIARENIAPVYLGEFGSKLTDPKDVAWLSKLQSYLSGDYDANGTRDIAAGQQGVSWTWWSWNPNSGDTGGILKDDWTTVQTDKVSSLQPLMFHFSGDGGTTTVDGTTRATFTVSLSAAAATAVSVDYTTVPGTADASDFTATKGTLTFAPGETTKTVTVAVKGDAAAESNETFKFALSAPSNADLGHSTATATIVNDDGGVTTPTTPPSTGTPSTGTPPVASTATILPKTTVVNDWGTGVVTSTVLKNTGTAALDNWTIKLKTPLEITNIWNAEIVSHTNGEYVIHSAAWNYHLDPGQEISFGFQAAGHATAGSFDWVI